MAKGNGASAEISFDVFVKFDSLISLRVYRAYTEKPILFLFSNRPILPYLLRGVISATGRE